MKPSEETFDNVHIHVEPFIWTLRVYETEQGYEQRKPYIAVATISILGEKAWISGLHGKFNREIWKAIENWLISKGVTSVLTERHNKLREYTKKG